MDLSASVLLAGTKCALALLTAPARIGLPALAPLLPVLSFLTAQPGTHLVPRPLRRLVALHISCLSRRPADCISHPALVRRESVSPLPPRFQELLRLIGHEILLLDGTSLSQRPLRLQGTVERGLVKRLSRGEPRRAQSIELKR